jgi:hypothetical protein
MLTKRFKISPSLSLCLGKCIKIAYFDGNILRTDHDFHLSAEVVQFPAPGLLGHSFLTGQLSHRGTPLFTNSDVSRAPEVVVAELGICSGNLVSKSVKIVDLI